MILPITLDEYLEGIARESAKMSWPGQMSPILKAQTKRAVEDYFARDFLKQLWNEAETMHARGFDKWHEERASELSKLLADKNCIKHVNRRGEPTYYDSIAVACKLLNTFMHQLMKYQNFRPLWCDLHLVLDDIVLGRLSRLRQYKSLAPIRDALNKNPYTIPYPIYSDIQKHLLSFIAELNRELEQRNAAYKITSRIELNAMLWAQ